PYLPGSAFACRATIGTSRISAWHWFSCTAWNAAVVVGYVSGRFDGWSLLLIQSSPVVFVCAHVWRLFRSAMLFGGVVCFEMSTPWFAFRYVDVKSTVLFRWAVIVAS